MRFSMNEIISSFYFVLDLDTDIVESLFWFGFGFGFFFQIRRLYFAFHL